MNTPTQNPYIGPRTFKREERDRFFGRNREARDLAALVATEKLVLFYAQSGAGKSSLINTCLIPELEQKLFEVLPVARVSGQTAQVAGVENIYIYNLFRSLISHEVDPALLSQLTISQFLDKLNEDEKGYFYDESLTVPIRTNPEIIPWPRALIIDQFEEIFSTNIEAWKKREDFFCQLEQAMREDPYLWVVLVMREDYIAALDPYAHLLPGGLRMRYYMERLGREAAIQAVRSPVEHLRPYAEGVAEKLVKDLSSIKVQKPDGKMGTEAGQYIEPVQLQVVCYSLWEHLPSAGQQITEKDLEEVGDVDEALERYYEDRVLTVAKNKGVPERQIREWFGNELITTGGTRNIVLRNSKPDGLSDDVIRALEGDLVRAEIRAGQTWYELSHDRLIEPVQKNNKAWFEKHLSVFERQAELWKQQGRGEGLLLRGAELEKAEAEVSQLTLNKDEVEFLNACRALRKRENQDRFQKRVILGTLAVAIVLLGFAVYSFLQATEATKNANRLANERATAQVAAQMNAVSLGTQKAVSEQYANNLATAKVEAEQNANRALAGNLVGQANSSANSDHAKALLIAVEAYKRNPNDLTKETLFNLLQFTPYKKITGFPGVVNSVSVSPDGKWIAVASCNEQSCNTRGEIKIFNDKMEEQSVVPAEYGIINNLAFAETSERGLVLAGGGCNPEGCSSNSGQISLWEISDTGTASLLEQKTAHNNLVKTLEFSPDGSLLASGSYDTTILLWDPNDLSKSVSRPLDHGSFVNDITFDQSGDYLVSAGDDKAIYIWNISNREEIPEATKITEGLKDPVSSVQFSLDGKKLASGGYDRLVRIWDWSPEDPKPLKFNKELRGHSGYVTSLDFISDTLLASAGFDNKVIIWDFVKGEQVGPALSGHTRAINQVASGPSSAEPFLISVGNDRTAIQWLLQTRSPLSVYPDYLDPENQKLIQNNLLTPDGWADKACEAAKRNLTQDEWTQLFFGPAYQKTCPSYE